MDYLMEIVFLAVGLLLGYLLAHFASKARLATVETKLQMERERSEKLEREYSLLSEKFRNEFKSVADAILAEQTHKVQADAHLRLESLLQPVREKLAEFQNSLIQSMAQQSRDNAALKEQIRQLTDLSNQVSAEANRLTNALRADSRVRGNWGEMVLERLLEVSGLEKGIHYETQITLEDEEGNKYRPDVVIHFPESKDVIIDSKVSLIDYEKLTAASDPQEQESLRQRHYKALEKHMDDLSKKNYTSLKGIKSLDMIFMFVPIEGAFMEALRYNSRLYEEGFRKKVIILTPSTLLATLRLVHTMWQQYNQNQNAQKIAEEGGKLYDKFCQFLDDFNKIGSKLSEASKAYEEALKKLSTGRGNLIQQAENFRRLGISNKKTLPDTLSQEW
ncbi:MAG: DNA recombination protein RmuC [Leptospiraceae bacterium]|nr:DNA recombination protein RmuC [Leptospiraceae bacterium]MDW8307513.1 DNA recombination protein RmuC [Leptospiraceae bacterium]